MLNNLRYALRTLASKRGFKAIVACLLAVGIDGNALVRRVNPAAIRQNEIKSLQILGKHLRHVVAEDRAAKCAVIALVQTSGVSTLFTGYQSAIRHLLCKRPASRNDACTPASNQRSALHAVEVHCVGALHPRDDCPAPLAL